MKIGLHRYPLIICVQVLSAAVFGLLPLAIPQDSAQDSKVSVVKAFMAARTLRHNVEARKRMTARLEKAYLHDKRLSIRVRSGRVAAFRFRPTSIFPIDHEKFLVSVESTWIDLNNQVSSTIFEQIKFIKINREWVADKITFLKSIPRRPVLPFNIASEKQAKFALRVAKKFMKHLVDRDLEKTTHLLTQKFQSQFTSREVLKQYLLGSEDPTYVAFEVTSLAQTESKQITVGTTLYLTTGGEMGFERLEASLILTRGSFDWIVDGVEFKVS